MFSLYTSSTWFYYASLRWQPSRYCYYCVRAEGMGSRWIVGGACWSDLTGRVSAVPLEWVISTLCVCVCVFDMPSPGYRPLVCPSPLRVTLLLLVVHVNDSQDKAFDLFYNPTAVCILSIWAAAGDLIYLYIVSNDPWHFPLNNCSGSGSFIRINVLKDFRGKRN